MQEGRVTVFRFDPEKDAEPYYETLPFPFEPGMSVLDVAFYLYETVDATFSFSYCCRNSHCGLCGAKINGTPGLMCRESATPHMTLEPLDHLPVLRDLVVDRQDHENRKVELRLFLERVRPPSKEPEQIDLEALDRFKVASRCVECYSCVSDCPAVHESKHEFLGPASMVQLARHAFDPRDELNRPLMAYSGGLYNCTECGRCSEVCPHEIAPADNINLLRARLVASGRAPRAVTELMEMVGQSQKALLPPVNPKATFLQERAESKEAKVGFFVGCNFDYDPRLKPSAVAAVKVLQALGVDLTIPPDQVCCGTPLKEAGAHEALRTLVLRNIEAFQRAGVEIVLTLCSGCSYSFKRLWPEIFRKATGREMPFQGQDLVEYLAAHPGLPAALRELRLRVTYHDPCLLRRGQGIYKEPRQLLSSIPGLQLQEMEKSDTCCGGGGGLRMNNLDLAKRILKSKVAFLKDLEIDALVTGCPTCIKQLRAGLSQQRQDKIKVLHPALLIAQAMGLE